MLFGSIAIVVPNPILRKVYVGGTTREISLHLPSALATFLPRRLGQRIEQFPQPEA